MIYECSTDERILYNAKNKKRYGMKNRFSDDKIWTLAGYRKNNGMERARVLDRIMEEPLAALHNLTLDKQRQSHA